MRWFDIYEGPDGGAIEAVKLGFSWPAFFFSWIWAFAKGLPRHGGVLLLGCAAAFAGSRIADRTLLQDLLRVVPLALGLWAGALGNAWWREALEQRGWVRTASIEAPSPRRALLDQESAEAYLARGSSR